MVNRLIFLKIKLNREMQLPLEAIQTTYGCALSCCKDCLLRLYGRSFDYFLIYGHVPHGQRSTPTMMTAVG